MTTSVREVLSDRNPNVTYKVTLNIENGQVISYTCECRDYEFRVATGLKECCKHLYRAL